MPNSALIPIPTPQSEPQAIQLQNKVLPESCHCRASLASCVPDLETAIQQRATPQLDAILQVTEEVITKCRSTIHCPTCQMRPADLVSIATVFQQTAACFDHMFKSSLHHTEDDSMKIGIGDYEVSSANDAMLKRMLVLNLIKQAVSLLDSLSDVSQSLFMSPPLPAQGRTLGRSPICLNQVNLSYVRDVVVGFKKFFRLITEKLQEQLES